MRAVRDDDGERYLVVDADGAVATLYHPASGETRERPTSALTDTGEQPLATAARAVDSNLRALVSAVHDDRALGMLLEVDRRGPLAVRTLLDATDLCESDLHGRLLEFQVAGLIEETDVGGERAYRTTATASDALDRLRD